MRRAERLFSLVQHLRRRRVTTAARLARELEVSERTVYRDIRDLVRSGVPISGEAGVGYALPVGFDLPPLMFTPAELEAVVLGVRSVRAWGDEALGSAAASALARIEAALPRSLREGAETAALFAPAFHVPKAVTCWLAVLRSAIAEKRKLTIQYARADGQASRRVIWPLGLFFWGYTWSLIAWCELRGELRHFRLDRIAAVEANRELFTAQPGRTLDDFLRAVEAPRD